VFDGFKLQPADASMKTAFLGGEGTLVGWSVLAGAT